MLYTLCQISPSGNPQVIFFSQFHIIHTFPSVGALFRVPIGAPNSPGSFGAIVLLEETEQMYSLCRIVESTSPPMIFLGQDYLIYTSAEVGSRFGALVVAPKTPGVSGACWGGEKDNTEK